MEIAGIAGTVMAQVRELAGPDAVVGRPVYSGGSVIIPVSKISFGFSVGGRGRRGKAGDAFGAGAGAKVEPVACIVITGGKAELLPVNGGRFPRECLARVIPAVIRGVWRLFQKRGRGKIGERCVILEGI